MTVIGQDNLTPIRNEEGLNCGCRYPPCGCLQITLEPTVIISPIATFSNPATPDIPNGPTVFPTLTAPSEPIVTQVATNMIPTLIPVPSTPSPPDLLPPLGNGPVGGGGNP